MYSRGVSVAGGGGGGATEGRPGYSKRVDFFVKLMEIKKKAMTNYENITLLQQLKQQLYFNNTAHVTK